MKKQKVTKEQYAIAKTNKISKSLVLRRLEEHWGIEAAITTPVRPYTRKEEINPASYAVAAMNDISAERLEFRVHVLKMHPWDAATLPLGKHTKRPKPSV